MPKERTLPEVFRREIEKIAAGSLEQGGDWKLENKEDRVELVIPKIAEDGFNITVIADDEEVSVYSEYLAHQHFTSDGDHEAVCQLAMGLVRDLLSPLMRLRVVERGGSPVRAHFETVVEGDWKREATTGLLVLPFFGKKTEKFYINRRLSVRKDAYR